MRPARGGLMSNRRKADGEKASPRGGHPPSQGKSGTSQEQRQKLGELLLGIVEQEIGRGGARRPEDWTRLRTLAVGHPGASDLVTSLEGVIQQFNREIASHHGNAGVDTVKIRDSVAQVIRVSLAKKLGLSDRPTADQPKTSPGKGSPPASGKNGSSLPDSQQVSDLLLGILEREIGRGEARRPEDWARVRALAAGHPGTTELVTSLEGAIQTCNQEMGSRFASAGVDVSRIRQSMLSLIRVSLLKKLGMTEGGNTRES
jgi:hypothetical protein